MFLHKRNNIYYLVYQDENKKRKYISTKCKNKASAFEFVSNFKAELAERRKNKIDIISLEKASKIYLDKYRLILSANRIRNLEYFFNLFLRFTGKVKLIDIKQITVEKFILESLKSKSILTIRDYQTYLKKFFSEMKSLSYLPENNNISFLKLKPIEKTPEHLTESDMRKLLSNISDEDFKDIILMGYLTGLRKSEMTNLQWQDVNIESELLTLSNHLFITKSKKPRTIPLSKQVIEMLKRRYLKRANDYVFTCNNKMGMNLKWNGTDLSHRFKQLARKTFGGNTAIRVHSLRHSFCTQLAINGASLYIIAKLAGHSDTRITQKYAHLNTDNLRAENDKHFLNLN